MGNNCDDNDDCCGAKAKEHDCAWNKRAKSPFGGSCPFCELFIEVLRNNEIAKKDLAMLSFHLDKAPYHSRADA